MLQQAAEPTKLLELVRGQPIRRWSLMRTANDRAGWQFAGRSNSRLQLRLQPADKQQQPVRQQTAGAAGGGDCASRHGGVNVLRLPNQGRQAHSAGGSNSSANCAGCPARRQPSSQSVDCRALRPRAHRRALRPPLLTCPPALRRRPSTAGPPAASCGAPCAA